MSGNKISIGRPPVAIADHAYPKRACAPIGCAPASRPAKSTHLQSVHDELRRDVVAHAGSPQDLLKLVQARFAAFVSDAQPQLGSEEQPRPYGPKDMPLSEADEKKQIVRTALDHMSRSGVGMSPEDAHDSVSYILRVIFPHATQRDRIHKLEDLFREANVPTRAANATISCDQLTRICDALLKQIDAESAVIGLIKLNFPEYGKSDRLAAKALELLSAESPPGTWSKDALQRKLDNPHMREGILQGVIKDVLTAGAPARGYGL